MQQIELTESGYLHLPAALAEHYFAGDGLLALIRGAELWLFPTRGPAAGGLLIKRRNRHGDRSVLLSEVLPAGTRAGLRSAFWDAAQGALRVALVEGTPEQEPL